MDAAYLFLCGRLWLQFGKHEAGQELIRALGAPDAQIRVLARTMLEQAGDRSKQILGEALAEDRISPEQAALFDFDQSAMQDPDVFGSREWYPGASA